MDGRSRFETGLRRLRRTGAGRIVRGCAMHPGDGQPRTGKGMERNLFKYIWRHSWRDQAYILVIVVMLQVFYFISLDLPKRVVNDGIRGDRFKKMNTETLHFLHLSFGPYPNLGIPEITLFPGIALDQQSYLFALCFAFLFFVVLNGWMKQWVNTSKGRLGERMLRRLRFELFDRVLQFPLSHFRRVKQAEVATMIKDEVEPLGGFIGDAFIFPAQQIGTGLTALYFIFLQSFSLGCVTLGVLAVQMVVIPKL